MKTSSSISRRTEPAKRSATAFHVRRSYGGLDDLDASAFSHVVEGRPELVIPISQEDLRSVADHCRVAKVLRGPYLGRGPRCCRLDHASRREVDDEEAVDRPEE